MNFGIGAISFYTSNYYIDLQTLAVARNEDHAKFYEGLGQRKMSVSPPGEDIVTLAANAVARILTPEVAAQIEMVLVATESGVDFSKAAAVYLHKLFHLPTRCRVIELKQACYAATFGLQLALTYLRQNPEKKVLLVATDIARYDLNSSAESTQGSGAVALLLSAQPKIFAVNPITGFCTKETMDFWRPNYCDAAIVDGRLSCDIYMRLAEESFSQYLKLTGGSFNDFDRFCYHVPVPKLVMKTHKRQAKIFAARELTAADIEQQIGYGLLYNREVGNCYTASLFLSLLSMLENSPDDLSGKTVGLYSYGSGSSGEFFSGKIVPDYQRNLFPLEHQQQLQARQEVTYAQYAEMHEYKIPLVAGEAILPKWQTGAYCLTAVHNHQRIYEKVA